MILLRAYASIWDFINQVFGTHFMSLPPQTYGLFMAIAFLVGILLAKSELARKTRMGIFAQGSRVIELGKGIDILEVALYGFFGYFLGLKILGYFDHSEAFYHSPQDFILSLQGSTLGGILGAILLGGYTAWSQHRAKLPEVKKTTIVYNVEDRIGDILLIAMVGGVLGSKIMDALDNPSSMSDFLSNPIASLTSGLSVLGGLWLVSILLIYYARKNNIKILPFVDSLSPPFFLSYAIGRLGCQFAGDGCWGISTAGLTKPSWLPDVLWGNTYPHNVNREGIPIPDCTEAYCTVLPEPHLPTPLYETIIVGILFAILWSVRKRLTPYYGAITGLFLIFNGLERFFIEFIRVNTHYERLGVNLSQAQYISILMIAIGAALFYWAIYIQKREPLTSL